MKNSEIKLGWLKKWALKIAFSIVDMLIGTVKNKTAKVLLSTSIKPTKDIIDVVTDNVPDNGMQLKDLFESKGGEYVGDLLDGVKELIQEADKLDPQVKALIVSGLESLSNEVKDNL